ncbi:MULTISPECIES: tryptophan--tRNA ligase [unclassified Spiroplasma]|uniref:tryptophan--tRNA ligase n=1 Tax=unclassified Spiroplasma TaxID=2637901 RepID=UPI0031FE46CF
MLLKPRLLSGITNTGKITIGNYIGVIQNFIKLQEEYDVFIFVANLHAIVSIKNHDHDVLKNNIRDLVALYVACGLDPDKITIFAQSDILEHCQLGHILLCHTSMGELNRMTQFKDKTQSFKQHNNTETIPTGLFTYPALMAADILLYDATIVPVGIDQKQHLELTRNIAIRMNNKYGNIFTIPEPYIAPNGKKIMNLQNPLKKMSKSHENPKTYISLLDNLNDVTTKIKSAITDSENKIFYDEINKPGISNLLNIYCAFTNTTIEEATNEFSDQNYGVFKEKVAKVVCHQLEIIQRKYNEIIANDKWKHWLLQGKEKATKIAHEKLQLIQDKIGINY